MNAEQEDSPFTAVPDGVTVVVRLTPRASRAAVEGAARDADGSSVLKVRVTAPPADGAANAALVKLLAKRWRVPARSITIAMGARDRRKLVHVAGDPEALMRTVVAVSGESAR